MVQDVMAAAVIFVIGRWIAEVLGVYSAIVFTFYACKVYCNRNW